MESPHGELTAHRFPTVGVSAAAIAGQTAARHGAYLDGEAARAVAAAVLDAHDNIVTFSYPVWAEVWEHMPEGEKEHLRQDLVARVVVEAVKHGAVPVELPRLDARTMPDEEFLLGDRVEVRASVRVRYVAWEASAVPEQEAER